MSNPVTPFHSYFNERNTLKYDLDNSWFGNRDSKTSNIIKEHCDAIRLTQSIIVGPHDDQVFDFEKSTKKGHLLADNSNIDFSRVEEINSSGLK